MIVWFLILINVGLCVLLTISFRKNDKLLREVQTLRRERREK